MLLADTEIKPSPSKRSLIQSAGGESIDMIKSDVMSLHPKINLSSPRDPTGRFAPSHRDGYNGVVEGPMLLHP